MPNWYLGWSKEDAPEQAALRDQIQAGDRIAIKKLMGKGSRSVRITTLGIVTENDLEDECVYVRWVATDLDREVSLADAGPPSRGLLQSIAGPFDAEDPWTRIAFQL